MIGASLLLSMSLASCDWDEYVDHDEEYRTLYMYYDNGTEAVWHYDPTVRERLELRTYEVDEYGHVLNHQVFRKVYFDRDSIHIVHR